MNKPKLGFEPQRFSLPLKKILPIRLVKDPRKKIVRYKAILTSIKEVGVIEPLVVFRRNGDFLLMDGHLRYYALNELGITEAECIEAKEDEGFTYNARINRISPIQEHKMILKAINNGVSPEKIASALNVSVDKIKANTTLLDGIAPETVELTKDKRISVNCIRIMKRVMPARQIEMAQLMAAVNNYSAPYATALVANTPVEYLTEREKKRRLVEPMPEEIAKIEHEIDSMITDFKAAESSYGERVLNLSVLKSYIKRLLENAKVVRFLTAKHPEMLAQFEEIVALENLNAA